MAGCTLHPCDTGFEHVRRGPGPTSGMKRRSSCLAPWMVKGLVPQARVFLGPGRRALGSQTGDPGEAHACRGGDPLSCEVSLCVCLRGIGGTFRDGHCSVSASQWPDARHGACAELRS